MYDLPTTLSKFLNLGLSLREVIARATVRPAAAIRRPKLGTLIVGAPADIALFRLEDTVGKVSGAPFGWFRQARGAPLFGVFWASHRTFPTVS